ncbi:MAG: GTP-binding protein, partial [Patescibacteria group bacterium]
NDGVKPQTVEAIAHAKAAEIPLVVAINKVDLASPQDITKVKGQLVKEGVVVEDQGGESPAVAVSATTGQGVPELLEMIGLVADLLELKSDPAGELEAIVIESSLSSQQGPLATLVVKKGTLKVGDPIFAGAVAGKVKALIDDRSQRLTGANPGDPVQVLGFSAVPAVGATVSSQESVVSSRAEEPSRPTDQLTKQPDNQTTSLNVILRADTQGSLEAIEAALAGLGTEVKRINPLLKSVGPIADSDIRLAAVSKGVVLGFNVPVGSSAQRLADDLGVGVRSFTIIYELLEVAEKLLSGAQVLEEEKKAPEAEVLATFTLHSGDVVAGVRVLNGKIKYRDRINVFRGAPTREAVGVPTEASGAGEEGPVHEGRIRGLKVGKDEVQEAKAGQEAGILIKPDFEFKKGDRIVVI